MERTQVCIVGAGPAGLLLGHLLRAEGIECVVLEQRSPDYVLGRIRAGVLEQITVSLMQRLGLDDRLKAEGLPHDGFNLADGERLIRIDVAELTGQHVVVYGQTELTKDLMDASQERGLEVIYGAEDVALHEIESDTPFVTYRKDGADHRIEARFIAGCDGFHGPSRKAIPAGVGTDFEREYPFGWLGILADVPPCNHELIYSHHARGFALASMRSEARSRYYIDVPLTERIEDWPDERIWDELLTDGMLIYGVSSDDTHHLKVVDRNKSNPGRGWVMVHANELTPKAISDAMDRGDFYATSGVMLGKIELTDKTLKIVADEPATDHEVVMDPREYLGIGRRALRGELDLAARDVLLVLFQDHHDVEGGAAACAGEDHLHGARGQVAPAGLGGAVDRHQVAAPGFGDEGHSFAPAYCAFHGKLLESTELFW